MHNASIQTWLHWLLTTHSTTIKHGWAFGRYWLLTTYNASIQTRLHWMLTKHNATILTWSHSTGCNMAALHIDHAQCFHPNMAALVIVDAQYFRPNMATLVIDHAQCYHPNMTLVKHISDIQH